MAKRRCVEESTSDAYPDLPMYIPPHTQIAIQNSMVRIQETLDVKNDGKSELKEVSICLASSLASHLAFSEVGDVCDGTSQCSVAVPQ